jgi:hypothetical protein
VVFDCRNRNALNAETGEYGLRTSNPASGTGAPNGTLNTGEDLNGNLALDAWP